MANFSPLAAEIVSLVWDAQQIFTGFASWLRYCRDVAHRKPTKLCTMFGRLLGVVRGMELRNFAEGAVYIRLGGHHVGHRLTF